jgi:hypothetical protein
MRAKKLIALLALTTLSGACASLAEWQPPRVPPVPAFPGAGRGGCAIHIAEAHVALAAPHDPTNPGATAHSFATHALAMHQYHVCLAGQD